MTADPLEARPVTPLATHPEQAARHQGFPAAPVPTASSSYRFTGCTWLAATGTPVAPGPRDRWFPAAPGQEDSGPAVEPANESTGCWSPPEPVVVVLPHLEKALRTGLPVYGRDID